MAAEQTSGPVTMTLLDAMKAYASRVECETMIVRDSDGRKRKFPGVEVGYTSSRWIAGREQSRWTERTLYALADGRFVLATEHVTCWQGETNSYELQIFPSAEEAIAACSPGMLSSVRKNLCQALGVEIPEEEEATPL